MPGPAQGKPFVLIVLVPVEALGAASQAVDERQSPSAESACCPHAPCRTVRRGC
jgi:hypothetical protein